jgi:hypothetical protein
MITTVLPWAPATHLHQRLAAAGCSFEHAQDVEAALFCLPHLRPGQAQWERQEALRHVHEGRRKFGSDIGFLHRQVWANEDLLRRLGVHVPMCKAGRNRQLHRGTTCLLQTDQAWLAPWARIAVSAAQSLNSLYSEALASTVPNVGPDLKLPVNVTKPAGDGISYYAILCLHICCQSLSREERQKRLANGLHSHRGSVHRPYLGKHQE